jgi:hypothetical protein
VGFEPWAESSAAAWARAVVLHCRALLSEDESEAGSLFLAALDAHAQAARPIERLSGRIAAERVASLDDAVPDHAVERGTDVRPPSSASFRKYAT